MSVNPKVVATMLTETITRDNIDVLLDAGQIEIFASARSKWYSIRRNGQTKRWKRDTYRIAIPCKFMFHSCFTITERDFAHGFALNTRFFRIKP